MDKPRALRSGDRVALVAPASPFEVEAFHDGVRELQTLGFEPVYDESVFARTGFVAGTPALRAAALRGAFRDRSIRAVVGVRGGYGSAQVLPLLDADEIRQARIPVVGYSDLTALLTFVTLHCGLVAFHGPMLVGRLGKGTSGYDRASFVGALCAREPLGELTAPGLETIRSGEARGPIFGGTVTQLLASIGTPYAFDPPHGCVLFLDEVGERPYRLDRMVTQLKQTGLLARACAVVVGELPQCDEPSGTPTGRGVIADLLSDFGGPVLVGFPSGHTVGPATTLPFGVACTVVGGGRSRVIIEEAGVD